MDKQQGQLIPEPPEEIEVPQAVEPLEEETFSLLKIGSDKEFNDALSKIDNALKLVDQLRDFCLKRSKPNDWLDTGGNPYFTDAGCNRFRAPFQMFEHGVKFWTVDATGQRREITERSVFEGDIRFIFFEGVIGSKLLGVEASFQGGSRLDDNFRSKEDVLFYLQKGKANWNGRGFRKLLGLENLTWPDLEKAGIKHDQVRKVEYISTDKAPAADAQELWNNILTLSDGNEKAAEEYLFKLTENKEAGYKGKRRPSQLSAKQIVWVSRRVKEELAKKGVAPAEVAKATTNGNGNHGEPPPPDDAFQRSVFNLRQAGGVPDTEFADLLKLFGVAELVELPVAKRNQFLMDLGKVAHAKGAKKS